MIFNTFINYAKPIQYKYNKKYGLNKNEKRKNKIVVSITSIPSRYENLHLCLESIFRQTMKPDAVVLYLGEKNKNIELPKDLLNMKERGLTIKYCDDKRLKPHTKYYYAMQEFKDSIVITVDDDIYYNKKLIENLYKSYIKYPTDISCIRCHKMKIKNEKIEPYNLWDWEYNKNDALFPNNKLLATGVGGVLYPPNSMPKETYDIDKIEKLCLNADDIWLKVMQLMGKINVVKACRKNYTLYTIKGSQTEALSNENVVNNQNDVYLQKLLEFYNLNLVDIFKTNF